VAGEETLGVAREETLVVAGEETLGVAGEETLGVAGEETAVDLVLWLPLAGDWVPPGLPPLVVTGAPFPGRAGVAPPVLVAGIVLLEHSVSGRTE
jgi:hypothetical protein